MTIIYIFQGKYLYINLIFVHTDILFFLCFDLVIITLQLFNAFTIYR